MSVLVQKIIPEEEVQRDKVLAVQFVRDVGRDNVVVNVNKWYKPGQKVYMTMNDNNGFTLSQKGKPKQKPNIVRAVGSSFVLSVLPHKQTGYYTVTQNKNGLSFVPATTHEILRFSRKAKKSNQGECLVMHASETLIHLKAVDREIFNKSISLKAEFYHTEDNLMWIEVFQDGDYSEGATKCSVYQNQIRLPKKIQTITGIKKGDKLKCFPKGNRLIIEVPNVSCETCGTEINRRTTKSKVVTVSQSTKDACGVIRSQSNEGNQGKALLLEAFEEIKKINKFLEEQ